MSKDGPAAESFLNPHRMGWLTKHGGSGVGANWRKRWFVLDHHYIFYYKQKNDKRPVGVVCLADYKVCRKAEQKECKKNHSFILEKGDLVDDLDYPVRNYMIHADSDSDMTEWINAINMEIQPSRGRRVPANECVKADDTAFDALSTTASEGPKLMHPTAARPRVKGRRPPRRYTPYNEDDSKEDPGESSSPSRSKVSPPTQPKPSPSIEPKSTSSANKTKPLPSPSLSKSSVPEKESPEPAKKKPMTPKTKPLLPPEEAKAMPVPEPQQAKDEEQFKPKTPPAPHTKPKPPPPTVKPRKKSSMTEEKQPSLATQKQPTLNEEPPSPGDGMESTENIGSDDGTPRADAIAKISSLEDKEVSTHKPIPRPKPRKPSEMPVRSPSPIEHATPMKPSKPKPVPRARTVTTSKPTKAEGQVEPEVKAVENDSTGRESPEEEQTRELPVCNDSDVPVITVSYKQASPSDNMEIEPKTSMGDGDGGKELGVTVRQISYQNVTINIKDSGAVTLSAPLPEAAGPKELCPESLTCPVTETEELFTADSLKEPVQGDGPPKGCTEELSQDDCGHKLYGSDTNVTPPIATPTSKQENVAESVEVALSFSPRNNGQENKPDSNCNQIPEQTTLLPSTAEEEEEHYVEVDTPGIQARSPSPDKGSYDIPRPTCSPVPQSHSSSLPEESNYDIPRPLSKDLLQEQQEPPVVDPDVPKLLASPVSSAQTEHEMVALSPDYDVPSSVLTPLLSTSSSLQAVPGRRENGIGPDNDGEHQHKASISSNLSAVSQYGPSPQRDAWGYAIVNKDNGSTFHVSPEQPHDWLARHLQSVESGNVLECVQKAKELLRQARIIKAQAEESKKEACRELELARREKHDAAIMKKNAAEILKIAKEKLKAV